MCFLSFVGAPTGGVLFRMFLLPLAMDANVPFVLFFADAPLVYMARCVAIVLFVGSEFACLSFLLSVVTFSDRLRVSLVFYLVGLRP